MKNNQVENTNKAGNNLINDLNYKIQILQDNISSLENQKYQEEKNFENQKYDYEEQIKQLKQEIEELEDQLNTKLNGMTSGVINIYLKYDNNTKNYTPNKDKFSPSIYGYSLREFEFIPQNSILLIKDMRNKIIEKK